MPVCSVYCIHNLKEGGEVGQGRHHRISLPADTPWANGPVERPHRILSIPKNVAALEEETTARSLERRLRRCYWDGDGSSLAHAWTLLKSGAAPERALTCERYGFCQPGERIALASSCPLVLAFAHSCWRLYDRWLSHSRHQGEKSMHLPLLVFANPYSNWAGSLSLVRAHSKFVVGRRMRPGIVGTD